MGENEIILQPDSTICVLNVDFQDHQGEPALNDEKLLTLISLHPFLYSPRCRPFKDPDYEEWAWERIRDNFNHNYIDLNVVYTVQQLKDRWEFLIPKLRELTKLYDLGQVPANLRDVIIKMTVQLEDQATDATPKLVSRAEAIILDNIEMVKKLPSNQCKLLENEILELILNAERNFKGTIKLTSTDIERIKQESGAFFESIHLQTNINERTNTNLVKDPKTLNTINTSNEELESVENLALIYQRETDHYKSTITANKQEIKEANVIFSNDDKRQKTNTTFDKNEASTSKRRKYGNSEKSSTRTEKELNLTTDADPETLLTPIKMKRHIPIAQVGLYVRKFRIRLKRINLEDYLPVSKYRKKRKKNTNIN